MTPPFCPTCGRRGSEREVCVPGTPPYDDEMHGEVCPSPFHDAGDWGPALLEALKSATNWAKMFLMGCTIHESQELSCQEDVQRIDDLLAECEGRKEEIRDESK